MKKLLILGIPFLMFSCNQENKQGQNTNNRPTTEPLPSSASSSTPAGLPEGAKSFIATHFPEAGITKTEDKMSPSKDGTMHEAKLSEGTEVDFDKDGNWTEISTEGMVAIPLAVLPQAIQDHLNANFNGLAVQSADKEPTGYELELANETELFYDLNGKFIRQGR